MAVITISRQYGAGAMALGHRLADKYGYTLASREIVQSIADKAKKFEAFAEAEKMEAAGKQEARSILKQTREEIADQQRKASDEIRNRIEAVQQELGKEVETLSAAIIAKVLERRSPT